MESTIILLIIKMIVEGIAAFLSILVLSKTRNLEWVFLVIGFVFSYLSLIVELLQELGIISKTYLSNSVLIFNVPLISFLCVIVPSIFFIIAFILKLIKK